MYILLLLLLLLLLLYTIKYVKFNIDRKMALLVSKYYVLFLKLYYIFIFLVRNEKDGEKLFIYIYRHCTKLLFIVTPNVCSSSRTNMFKVKNR
jgi:hypothetical protein